MTQVRSRLWARKRPRSAPAAAESAATKTVESELSGQVNTAAVSACTATRKSVAAQGS